MFVEIVVGLIFTALCYMVVPLIFLAVNHGRFEKRKATKIALWNSIIVGVIFCIVTILIDDSGIAWSAAPAFLYYFINNAVIGKKAPQKKAVVCEKENSFYETTPCSSLYNNDNIVEHNENGLGDGECYTQNEMPLRNTYNFRDKKTKKVVLIIGIVAIVLIAFIPTSIMVFKYQESYSNTQDTGNTKGTGNTKDTGNTEKTDNSKDAATKTWFLKQYNISKQQYLKELNDEITEKESAITELEAEATRLYVNYQKEIKYINVAYANTSVGIIQSELRKAESKYNDAAKKCTDSKNTLREEINAIKNEVNNPNVDNILAIVAENCNMTSKEIYEYYYKYSDSIS